MEKLNFNKKTDEELKGTELDYKDGKLNIISKSGEVLIDRGENKKEDLPPHKLTPDNLKEIKTGKTQEENKNETKKYKVGIVDISSSIESQAEDIAEARMAKDKKDTNMFSRFFKHNILRAAYKQAYLIKARKDIMKSGNLYAGETGDAEKDAIIGQESAKGTIGRYLEEYEGQEFGKGVQTDAGELRTKIESKSPEEILAKEKVENLLDGFARGRLSEEQFLQEKDLVLKQLRDSKPEHFDQGKIFADNLLEIANKIKIDIEHTKGLAKVDIDFDLIIGRARSGVRTEAQMTALNKLVEKVNNRSFGVLSGLINETTVGIGGALAVSLVTTITKSKLAQWGTFGLSVLASGSIAYAKEKWRLGQERKQHIREMTKGKSFEDDAERRKEMEKYRYATRDAKDLISSLARLTGGVEISSGKDLTPADLETLKPLAQNDSELAGLLSEYQQQLKKIQDMESDLNSDFMRVKDEKARRPKEEDLIVQKRKLAKMQSDIDLFNADNKHTNNIKPKNIDSSKFTDIKEKVEKGEMTLEELNQAMADLADIEARIKLSNEKKIDLISFSSIKNLENERWALDKARANAKIELRKLAESGKLPIPAGMTFDKYLESMVSALENGAIGQDISEKDKTFNKMKEKKAIGKGLRTVGYGLVFGAAFQEGWAMLSDKSSGLVEHALKMGGMDKSDGNLTPVASLWSYLTGHQIFNYNLHDVVVPGGYMKLPWDMTMSANPDGSFNLMRGAKAVVEHLKFNGDGSLTDEARKALGGAGILSSEQIVQITNGQHGTVSTKDFLDHHSKDVTQIHRGASALGKGDMHFDNNTPFPKIEQNELGLHYGFGGTGINPETGHYSYDIRSMTEGGSFHGTSSLDVIKEAARVGHPLKMLISLDKNNPFKVFEFLVKPDGTIDIDPNSEAGKLAFKVVGGHLQFNGATAEIAHSLGFQPDGIEKFNIIATAIGKGISNIEIPKPGSEIISTLNIPQGTDIPWFVPLMQRTPLERARYKEEQEKAKNKAPKSEKGPDNDKIPGKERPIAVEKPPEAVKEKIGKERPIPANERNLAEKIVESSATIALLKEKYGEEKDSKIKKEIQKEIDSQEKELEEDKKIQSIVKEAINNKESKKWKDSPVKKLEEDIAKRRNENSKKEITQEDIDEAKIAVGGIKFARRLAQARDDEEFQKIKKETVSYFEKQDIEDGKEIVKHLNEINWGDQIPNDKEGLQSYFHKMDLLQNSGEAVIVGDSDLARKYLNQYNELEKLDEEEKEETNPDGSVIMTEPENTEKKEENLDFYREETVSELLNPRLYEYVGKFIKKDLENNTIENPNSDTLRFKKLIKEKQEIIKVLETILDPKMKSKDFDKAINDFNKNKSIPGIADIEQNISFGNINEQGKSRRLLSIKIAKDGGVYLSPTR